MGALDGLLNQVKDAITQHASGPGSSSGGFDATNLINHVTDLFQNHPHNNPQNVKPASQDPYGDPADQPRGAPANVKPASADPYGDPADDRRR
jgi:hypothetical protein